MRIGACAAYTAAEFGILGFTRHLAFEIGPYKIREDFLKDRKK
jgi:NAD(P)-dependent dehydrogenase (short-subunit alcohol dehydrogenase family)